MNVETLKQTHPLPKGYKWARHSDICPVCIYRTTRSPYAGKFVAWVDVTTPDAVFSDIHHERERIPVPSLEAGVDLIYARCLLGMV